MEQTNSSKVRIFALGGLGENGKNMYVVEVDNGIYVFDAGLKPPTSELIGVDAIIADISYLIENKGKIKGIFLTSGHEDHIGAMPFLLKKLNVSVYGSRLTMTILEDLLKEHNIKVEDYKLYKVKSDTDLKFGKTKVTFFGTTHSIPDTLGIVIKTDMGNIVYTGDFTLLQNFDKRYQTSFHKISDISREGVLALLSESLGANNTTSDNTDMFFERELNKIFYNAKNRIIMTVYSSDLDKIQKIINTAVEYKRKIAIIGRKMQRMVDIAVNLGYLRIPKETFVNLRFIDEKNTNNYQNLVVLVTGARNEPFDALRRIANQTDRLIHLQKSDTVIIGTPTLSGIERKVASTMDIVHKYGASVVEFNKKHFSSSHASANDLKLMTNFLNPKYVIPVIGEYIQLVNHTKILESIGMKKENIIIMDNGDVAEFQSGELVSKLSNEVETNEVLIDGTSVCDTESISISERQLLAEDGMLIVQVTIKSDGYEIVSGPSIITKGYIYVKNNTVILEQVKKLTSGILSDKLNTNKPDLKKIKANIEYRVGQQLKSEFGRKPIIIPIITFV